MKNFKELKNSLEKLFESFKINIKENKTSRCCRISFHLDLSYLDGLEEWNNEGILIAYVAKEFWIKKSYLLNIFIALGDDRDKEENYYNLKVISCSSLKDIFEELTKVKEIETVEEIMSFMEY